jgi:hypothetical protein
VGRKHRENHTQGEVMSDKLIPPDFERCQSEITTYHPFVMGGNPYQTNRCENKPAWLATEPERKDKKKRGSMTLCEKCKPICEKQMPGVEFKKL